MKIIEWSPYSDTNKDMNIRCSELNWYFNPMMYAPKTLGHWLEAANLWDRIHDVMQHTLLINKERWYKVADRHIAQVNDSTPRFREKEMRWFAEGAYNYVDMCADVAECCDTIETKRVVIISYKWFNIGFSGTSDLDYENISEWVGWMDDIKSCSSKRQQEKADEQRQKYYYTWLKCVTEWLDSCKFRYVIATRQKKPQLQIFEYMITKEEAEAIVKDDITQFIRQFEPKTKSDKAYTSDEDLLQDTGFYDDY